MGRVDDLNGLPLRALVVLARERLGPAAGALKTRAELLAALLGTPLAPPPPPGGPPPSAPAPPRRPGPGAATVVRDFFVRRS